MDASWELKLDRRQFLADYWQQKPLLIKGAIADFTPPVSGDDLAGLALEEEVESRLIERRDSDWRLLHGPFNGTEFNRQQPWSLLVQSVDHWVPAVAALRRLIDFIPQWRLDDIMVSYSTDGGSAGPHYDNYDVFLLQGEGEKRWQLGSHCDDSCALVPHDELRILAAFKPQQEYVLRRGDMLYLPPGIAHWGVAQGVSTTFSIGFRAPRLQDMVARWGDHLLDSTAPNHFFQDAKRNVCARPGEIASDDLQRASQHLQAVLQHHNINHWFGELVTTPREAPPEEPHDRAAKRLRDGPESITLWPTAKLAWQQEACGTIQVFANGERSAFSQEVLPTLLHLCASWELSGTELSEAMSAADSKDLLVYLLAHGAICVE